MENNEKIIKRKLDYINKIYEISFDNISDLLIEVAGCNPNIYFINDLDDLLKKDQFIHKNKKAIEKAFKRNPDWNECKELYHRLSLVHKAVFEFLRTEHNITSCWEENDKLQYVKC